MSADVDGAADTLILSDLSTNNHVSDEPRRCEWMGKEGKGTTHTPELLEGRCTLDRRGIVARIGVDVVRGAVDGEGTLVRSTLRDRRKAQSAAGVRS